ncbi:arginase family protein [Alcaligenes faecalis]|uniref:arginase family protein n=1 Tax=Alcaligenes faecalis TaxID=511 RepID=UPI001C83D728|nr:arginase family protein [Alcaligenes faecalis]MBX6963735.1 arginase family protein [Providencia rettgeri]MBX7030385.1 arginase family protein [Alcaligenes faecalis]
MDISLLCSQGRVADRTNNTLAGARYAARHLASLLGKKEITVGQLSPAEQDKWPESLDKARPHLGKMAAALSQELSKNKRVILTTSTCPTSLATIPEVVQKYPDIKLLWFDGHGDFNTPSSSDSAYLGGMVVSAVCGVWDAELTATIKPENVIIVGAHDIDPPEQVLLDQHRVQVIPPAQVQPDTLLPLIGDSPIWIHVDWDVLEPGHVPAEYKVKGGITLEQLRAVFRALPLDQVKGLELAEFSAQDDNNLRWLKNIEALVTDLLN